MTKKLISVALALFLLLGCLSGVSLAAETYTREQKQQILVETALQYYYHNPYVQYDGIATWEGGPARTNDAGFPEDAAEDSTVYSVCSDYCYKIYYNAFAHKILGRDYARTRSWAVEPTGSTPIVVYQYKGPSAGNDVTGETDLEKALTESRKVLQPGDIIVAANPDAGHAMFFAGDCLGDGTEYVLHCWGSSHDPVSGLDPREKDGSIKLQPVDQLCYSPSGSPNYYLGKTSLVSLGFAILRPLDDPTFPSVPTAWGAARLQYPGLTITRVLDRTKFDGVLNGEEVPVTVTIKNNGKSDYRGLPVEEYVPEKATLVDGSASNGAQVSGKTLRWSLDIPAGQSATLTYKVKANGALGDTVDFVSGKVAQLPTRATSLQIVGKKLTDAQKQALVDYEKKAIAKGGDFADLAFFNEYYGRALGVDPGLPATVAELVKILVQSNSGYAVPRTNISAENAALARMILPLHLSGRYVRNSGFAWDNTRRVLDGFSDSYTANVAAHWSRVREYLPQFYQPGDLFICLNGSNKTGVGSKKDVDMFLYLGDSKVLSYGQDGAKDTTYANTISHVLKSNLVIALRPAQAYEDLGARTYSVDTKLPFTDVTEADWFYPFVKELVDEGIVNGMTPTTFVPKGNLTYGQALKLLVAATDGGEQAPLAGGHWASGYMRYAARQGWIGGTVELDAKITRLEFCKIAAKAKKLTDQPASNPFTDTADASVLALNKAGVINGMTATTFEPNGLLTRAQISKIIWALRSV